MLATSIFSFSHNVFYSSKNKFQFLSLICRLQVLSIWSSLKIFRLVKTLKVLSGKRFGYCWKLCFSSQSTYPILVHNIYYGAKFASIWSEGNVDYTPNLNKSLLETKHKFTVTLSKLDKAIKLYLYVKLK